MEQENMRPQRRLMNWALLKILDSALGVMFISGLICGTGFLILTVSYLDPSKDLVWQGSFVLAFGVFFAAIVFVYIKKTVLPQIRDRLPAD